MADEQNGVEETLHKASGGSNNHRSDSSHSSSTSLMSSQTDSGPVGPPPWLCVHSVAVLTPLVTHRQGLHGQNDSAQKRAEERMPLRHRHGQLSRGQACVPSRRQQNEALTTDDYRTCPLQRPLVLPTGSKTVVGLHTYEEAARELEMKQATTEQGRREVAATRPTSAIWQVSQPLR
ncbi:hypothetical protein Q4I30_001620 [Leishmania utingensis]|uniref:Uncharacterized protein n=1 Tax=Leishmania utingensis TaxID=653362 RepID=A0AAW3AX00_9TRYP